MNGFKAGGDFSRSNGYVSASSTPSFSSSSTTPPSYKRPNYNIGNTNNDRFSRSSSSQTQGQRRSFPSVGASSNGYFQRKPSSSSNNTSDIENLSFLTGGGSGKSLGQPCTDYNPHPNLKLRHKNCPFHLQKSLGLAHFRWRFFVVVSVLFNFPQFYLVFCFCGCLQ